MKIQLIKLIPWFLTTFFATLLIINYLGEQQKTIYLSQTETSLPLPTSQTTNQSEKQIDKKDTVTVEKIIDGDTIELQGGKRIRLIGIDAPEEGECLYQEAKEYLFSLLNKQNIVLEEDVQKTDKYGRTLAYVWKDNNFINLIMLKNGLAKLLTIPPNVKYVNEFIKAQKEAQEKSNGLWSKTACKQDAAANIPESPKSSPQVQSSNTSCLIKGNISSSGEKIYHMPGQRYYEKTKIDEERGERWFCTEEEAISAGWRKSKI
jgi:micrococcal nuclease